MRKRVVIHMYMYVCVYTYPQVAIATQIAIRYSKSMTPKALIKIFEEYNSMEGLYCYLGAIVNFSFVCPIHSHTHNATIYTHTHMWDQNGFVCPTCMYLERE